jgi:hypothetical protein
MWPVKGKSRCCGTTVGRDASVKLAFGTLLFVFAGTLCAQNIDPYRYFPSAVGNRWRWYSVSHGNTYDTEITRDSAAQDGGRYLFFNGSSDAKYLVDTSRQVWQIIGHTPVLWYRLDAVPGDTFEVLMSGYAYRVGVDSAFESAFGEPASARTYAWSYSTAYVNYAVQWLVYGVGFARTYSSLYGIDDHVTGYVIDGVPFGTLSGVDLPRSNMPTEFALHQNYPNPFNPTTTIAYALPRQSFVTLKVFDVLGEEVATLVEEMEEPGYKSVTFNGSKAPSGIYFYRLQAGSHAAVKKLILLR